VHNTAWLLSLDISMTAFERIFEKDPGVYNVLERSAKAAQESVAILLRFLPHAQHQTGVQIMAELAAVRREHKRIREQITDELWKTLAARLELEDIELLSSALYKVTKNVEKVAERLVIAPPAADCSRIDAPVQSLAQGSSLVTEMVGQFQHERRCDRVREAYARLQEIEDEADKAIQALLREIYDAHRDPRELIYWTDLLELLAKSIERCREAANGSFTFALKYF